MFPIRLTKILTVTTLVATLVCMPGAVLAAQPDGSSGTWFELPRLRVGLWLSELFGWEPGGEPGSIHEETGLAIDPDGSPAEGDSTTAPMLTFGVCDSPDANICSEVPFR
jgi:hypothetical protein